MPPIPNATQTIRDGALGVVNTDADKRNVKMGVCSAGVVNTLYEFSDPKAVQDTLGYGPLVEAICHSLAQPGAGSVVGIKLNASTPGASGSVVLTGTGSAVMSLSVGTAFDDFQGIVEILTAGANLAAATATFRYSLDGGDTYTQAIAVPTGGVYAIPNSGLSITWVDGTFVVGDKYVWASTAPGFSATDVNNAFTPLLADPREWGIVHVLGQASAVAGAVTIASAVGTKMDLAETGSKFGRAIVELPTDTDANIITGIAAFAHRRVSFVASYCELTSSISGRVYKRHAAWPYVARLGCTTVQRHPGCVDDGSLPGVISILRDENATPGLDAVRVTTLRRITGLEGFYVTNGKTMAPSGSDFAEIMECRVMDKACRLGRQRLLRWLNRDLKVDRLTGFLTKDEIAAIQGDVTQFIRAGMKAGQEEGAEVSDVTYVVTPSNPILSNKTIFGKVRVLTKAYGTFIETEFGFTNPALSLAAAA